MAPTRSVYVLSSYKDIGLSLSITASTATVHIPRTVLEHIWLPIDGEDNRTLIRMCFMERANPPPYELARSADTVVVVERTFNDVGLLDLSGCLCMGRVAAGSHFSKHVISPFALSSYRTLIDMPSN
jgi:hypothetical protein